MNDETTPTRTRRKPRYAAGILVWACVMVPLLSWGLPSERDDDLLFPDQPPWPAERYDLQADLAARRARDAGADTDLDPIAHPDRINNLTADHAARAEILQRYRLYSRQPDEVIIFQALQRMQPRRFDFDPRLYQYGGAYLYLVGAALGAAGTLGLTHLTPDAGYYLAHPEAFARFYFVARAISLIFGALALLAVARLAQRAAGRTAGWFALLAAALSPVFLTAVLEAKPHLPSAALVLFATLAALDYHIHGRWRDALRLGLLGGLAVSFVLTGVAVGFLWIALAVSRPPLRRGRTLRHLLLAALIAAGVYALTNPYVIYHVLTGGAALASNISNSTAMYADQLSQAGAGAARVLALLFAATGPALIPVGFVGFVLLLVQRRATLIVALPGLAMLLTCVLLGAGKPAEFARFLILPVLLLAVATGVFIAAVARRRIVWGLLLALVTLGTLHTAAYARAFVTDARGTHESRRQAGQFLATRLTAEDRLGVIQVPAPYAVPPVDFTRRTVWLLPRSRPDPLHVPDLPPWLVFTADDVHTHAGAWWQAYYRLETRFPPPTQPPSPIAWANKPTFVYRRTP